MNIHRERGSEKEKERRERLFSKPNTVLWGAVEEHILQDI